MEVRNPGYKIRVKVKKCAWSNVRAGPRTKMCVEVMSGAHLLFDYKFFAIHQKVL